MNQLKLFLSIVVLVLACEEPVQRAVTRNTDNKKEPLIRENRKWANTEDKIISDYIDRQKIKPQLSGTGLRYLVYKDQPGENIREGEVAEVKFTVKLLTGEECYKSEEGKTEKFLVGKDNVESGLHEGILHMSPGDKALFIVPSHLGHGLTGDLQKIPPRAPLVFDIELVGIE